MAISRILKLPVDIIAPPLCLLCDSPADSLYLVCEECKNNLRDKIIKPPICITCGAPLERRECLRCKGIIFSFDRARSIFIYRDQVMTLMEYFKYRRFKRLARFFGSFLVDNLDEFGRIDLIVPIPLHPVRRRTRGFSQTELLAMVLSSKSGIPFELDVLCKSSNTPPQVGLTKRARFKNVRGSFYVKKKEKVKARRILLVDDIMTTGATLHSASLALKRSSSESVSAIVVASG